MDRRAHIVLGRFMGVSTHLLGSDVLPHGLQNAPRGLLRGMLRKRLAHENIVQGQDNRQPARRQATCKADSRIIRHIVLAQIR